MKIPLLVSAIALYPLEALKSDSNHKSTVENGCAFMIVELPLKQVLEKCQCFSHHFTKTCYNGTVNVYKFH